MIFITHKGENDDMNKGLLLPFRKLLQAGIAQLTGTSPSRAAALTFQTHLRSGILMGWGIPLSKTITISFRYLTVSSSAATV